MTIGRDEYLIRLENVAAAARVLQLAESDGEWNLRYNRNRAWRNMEEALDALDEGTTEPFDVGAAAAVAGVGPEPHTIPDEEPHWPAKDVGPGIRDYQPPGELDRPAQIGDLASCPHGTYRLISMTTDCPECDHR